MHRQTIYITENTHQSLSLVADCLRAEIEYDWEMFLFFCSLVQCDGGLDIHSCDSVTVNLYCDKDPSFVFCRCEKTISVTAVV